MIHHEKSVHGEHFHCQHCRRLYYDQKQCEEHEKKCPLNPIQIKLKSIRDDISALDNEIFMELKNWIDYAETDRRRRITLKEEAERHKERIKKFRVGHKLVIRYNLTDIPAGEIVKLVEKKGRKKNILIERKNGEQWNVPIDYVGDAEDESDLRTARANARMGKLSDLFE